MDKETLEKMEKLGFDIEDEKILKENEPYLDLIDHLIETRGLLFITKNSKQIKIIVNDRINYDYICAKDKTVEAALKRLSQMTSIPEPNFFNIKTGELHGSFKNLDWLVQKGFNINLGVDTYSEYQHYYIVVTTDKESKYLKNGVFTTSSGIWNGPVPILRETDNWAETIRKQQ